MKKGRCHWIIALRIDEKRKPSVTSRILCTPTKQAYFSDKITCTKSLLSFLNCICDNLAYRRKRRV